MRFEDYADNFLTVERPKPQASWASGVGAAFDDAWAQGAIGSVGKIFELGRAGVDAYRYENADPESLGPYGELDAMAYEYQRKNSKRVKNADAKAKIKEAGVKLDIGDADISEAALQIMINDEKEYQKRAATVQSSDIGFVTQIGAALTAGILDPINLGAAFIPFVGPARYTALLESAGSSVSRTAVRAGVGAVEGLGGAALVEPLTAIAQTQGGRDYGVTNFLQNVAFGAMFGAVVHPVAGGIKDIWDARLNGSLPNAGNIAARLDPETYQQSIQAEIAHLVEGSELRASEVISQKAAISPFEPETAKSLKVGDMVNPLTDDGSLILPKPVPIERIDVDPQHGAYAYLGGDSPGYFPLERLNLIRRADKRSLEAPKIEQRTYTYADVRKMINTAISVNDGVKAGGGKASNGWTTFDILLSDYLPGLTRNKLQPFIDRLIKERGLVVQNGKIRRGRMDAKAKKDQNERLLHERVTILRHRIAERYPNIARNNTFYLEQLAQDFESLQLGEKAFIKYVNALVEKGEARVISEELASDPAAVTPKKRPQRLGEQHFDNLDMRAGTLVQFMHDPDPLPPRQPELSVTVDLPSRELPKVEAPKEPEGLARRVKLSEAIRRDGPEVENAVARQNWWIERLKTRSLRRKKTDAEQAEDAHTTYMFEQASVKPRTNHTIAARKIVEHEREVIAAERITADLESEETFLKELIGNNLREDELSPEALGELKADRAAINEQLAAEARDIDIMTACIIGE